jgi:hypothetical protein
LANVIERNFAATATALAGSCRCACAAAIRVFDHERVVAASHEIDENLEAGGAVAIRAADCCLIPRAVASMTRSGKLDGNRALTTATCASYCHIVSNVERDRSTVDVQDCADDGICRFFEVLDGYGVKSRLMPAANRCDLNGDTIVWADVHARRQHRAYGAFFTLAFRGFF